MNWKKRGQAGWNGRKTAKNFSKSIERNYSKKEIKQQLIEDLEGDDYRYKGGGRKRNKRDQFRYYVDYYERCLKTEIIREERARAKGDTYWRCSYCDSSYYRNQIEYYKAKIKEIDQKKQVS